MSRMRYELEGRLRFLAALQYPPQNVCSSTPLAIGRLLDNGWASMMALYGYARRKYTISMPYISRRNEPMEESNFATSSMCPHVKNKWLCAFLPPTNCSVPDSVTKSSGEKDLARALGQKAIEVMKFYVTIAFYHYQS